MIFRTGRKVKRTVYVQFGEVAGECGEDMLIGVLDTPELAAFLVEAANNKLDQFRDAGQALPDLGLRGGRG